MRKTIDSGAKPQQPTRRQFVQGALTAAFQPDCRLARHSEGLNMAFCDGHAKWLRVDTVVNEAKKVAPTPLGAWNPDNS